MSAATDTLVACTTCGAEYDVAGFSVLPLPPAGEHMDSGVEGYRLALRNCSCGSTLSAAVDADGGYLSREAWAEIEVEAALRDATAGLERAAAEIATLAAERDAAIREVGHTARRLRDETHRLERALRDQDTYERVVAECSTCDGVVRCEGCAGMHYEVVRARRLALAGVSR